MSACITLPVGNYHWCDTCPNIRKIGPDFLPEAFQTAQCLLGYPIRKQHITPTREFNLSTECQANQDQFDFSTITITADKDHPEHVCDTITHRQAC